MDNERDEYGNPFANKIEIGDPSRIDPALVEAKNSQTRVRRKIYSKESVKKLEALGFDPIEAMVNRYHWIQSLIDEMMNGPKNPSQVALSALLATQQKIANDLMRYGYTQVPEKDLGDEDMLPTRIILTGDDNTVTVTGNTITVSPTEAAGDMPE
jgi:hypothetical protein